MASTNQLSTVASSIKRIAGELRVSFDQPENGYSLHDLDTLEMAISVARRQFAELEPPTPTLEMLHLEQLAQMVPVPT